MNKQWDLLKSVLSPEGRGDPENSAATYGRYSTMVQKDTSLEDQAREHSDYAAQQGIKILHGHRYQDAARSGQSVAPRTAVNDLLNIVSSGTAPFKHVIIESTSRMGRNMRETLQVVETLTSHDVIVHFVHQKLRTDTKDWKRFVGMYALVDEWQTETIRDCTTRGMVGQIHRGYNAGKRIFGFRAEPEYSNSEKTKYGEPKRLGNRLVPVESEIEIVKHIFHRRVEDGWSLQRIADELNKGAQHE